MHDKSVSSAARPANWVQGERGRCPCMAVSKGLRSRCQTYCKQRQRISVWGRVLTSSANQELFRGSELKNELKNVIFMPKSRPERPPEPHFLAAEV